MVSNAISVQRFTTRSVSVHSNHTFHNYRLRDLGLDTLKFRRLHEDMTSLYKFSDRKAGMKEALGMGG